MTVLSMLASFCFWISPAVAAPGLDLVLTQPVETGVPRIDALETAAVWKEMIDGAKKRIDLQQMYASGQPGEPLDEIIARLEAAAKRGVKIRMLLEENMQRASTPATVERLKAITGLELRILKFAALAGDGIVHAKAMVVDGKTAFVGSPNFDWRALKHIYETGLRVSHPKIVSQLQAIFEFDWRAAELLRRGKKVAKLKRSALKPPTDSAYLVASPPDFLPAGITASEPELARLLGEAKEEIRVQLLDYYPLHRNKTFYPLIDNALRAAQARKVKIRLMVSHWNLGQPGVDHLKSLAVLPGVEIRVVTVPAAAQGFIPFARVMHSKTMVIDGKISWIGTSNWTGGYLDNSRNMEIVARDNALAAQLGEAQDQLWNAPFSAKIDVNKQYEKPNKGGE